MKSFQSLSLSLSVSLYRAPWPLNIHAHGLYIIDPRPLTALPPRKLQTLKWLYSGGTVVHISSGVSGLVAGGIVGPRRHVDKELGAANAPFVILGGCPE